MLKDLPSLTSATPRPGRLRRFLWFFLPGWLLLTFVCAGVVANSHDDYAKVREQAGLDQTRQLELLAKVELKSLVSNALLLRAQPDLQSYLLTGSSQSLAALAKSFLAFCRSKPGFEEVVLRDSQGQELLNVDNRGGRQRITYGQPAGEPAADPRLAASGGLAANEIIIYSHWQEQAGALAPEAEWLVELVQPVYDGSGRHRGALALSYGADNSFRELQEEPAAQDADLLLVGGRGLCLFSSYAGAKAGSPLPELWSRLAAAEQGRFRLGNAQYIFTTIKPMLEGLRHSTGSGEALLTSATAQRLMQEEQWRLVVRQSLPAWSADWRAPLLGHLPWYLATTLALGILGWALALRLTNREEAYREHSLAQERSRLRSAFEHAAIGMAVVSVDCRFLEVNHYLCQTLGRTQEELVGQTMGPYLEPDDHRLLLGLLPQALEGDAPSFRRELALISAAGERRWALVSISLSRGAGGAPLHFIVHALDITENKRIAAEKKAMEAELLRAQKMEAIGILAGGVAHDFNNILGIMCANAELVFTDPALTLSNQTHRRLERLLRAGERGRSTVAQILSFCQPQDEERQSLDLAAGVAENLKLLEASLPKQVSIGASLPTPGPCVRATPGEIQQIVTNLAVNASQAIGSQPGSIQVEVARVEATQALAVSEGRLEPGLWALLSVRDSGCGMDAQTLGKIFDPFFTTKEKGKGTGLGLTTIQRIVGSLGGSIRAESSPGQGSAFFVYLPLADAPPDTEAEAVFPARRDRPGALLIVDDEADYLATLREAMELHGYEVHAYADPRQAWEDFQARPREFSALISDNHMEGMSGTELARRVNHLRPSLPIILCSGSYQELVFESEREMGVYRIMRKPFTLAQLLETLNQALSAASGQGELFPSPSDPSAQA